MNSQGHFGLAYIRENRYYNRRSLAESLRVSLETAGAILTKLVADGAAESRTKRGEQFISLQFVGLVVHNRLPFLVLPKVVKGPVALDDRVRYLRLITRSVVRYASESPKLGLVDLRDFMSKKDADHISRLGLAIKLLEHWVDYGWHYRPTSEYELDGQGEADWDRTIDREVPFKTSTQQSVFLTLHTRRTLGDESHLIRRLHRAILANCEVYLSELGLLDFFAASIPTRAAEDLDDLVTSHDLNSALHHELSTVYSESAEERIRLMMAYLGYYNEFSATERITYLGTKSFHRIWETAMAWSFGNQLFSERGANSTVAAVSFHSSEVFEYSADQFPHWSFLNGRTSLGSPGEPDILLSGINYRVGDNAKYFWIVDAKYYDVSGSVGVERFPGFNDVMKQHIYQLAFEKRIDPNLSFSRRNLFVFPSMYDSLSILGTVSIPFLLTASLTEIDLVSLSLPEVLECYVYGASGSLRELLLDAF